MTLSPLMNTDIKIPKKMLDALNIHEAVCIVTHVQTVTENDVRAFLESRYGAEFASTFRNEYLFSSQAT